MINPNPQPPKYTVQQFQQFIQLSQLIQGDIKCVTVTQEFLEWYRGQVKQVAKTFNIPTNKNFKKDEFMGIELVVK